MLLEEWGIEIAKGIGRLFLNPLFYWAILLGLVVGYKRHQRDRRNFGTKIFGQGAEFSYTLIPSLVTGGLLSLLLVGAGVVFSYQTLLLLSSVVILLSLFFRLTILSASYTIGITYILLVFLPYILEQQNYFDQQYFSNVNFVGLALLLGLFLIVEGIMLKRTKKAYTYPDLVQSHRGSWIGRHHLSKLSVVPFFVLVPSGAIEPFADFWPYIPLPGESFGLFLFPFIIGFDYVVKGTNPHKASDSLAGSLIILGLIVVLLSVSSIYAGWLASVAVIAGILGKEWINYRHRISESRKSPYFPMGDEGLMILDIIPETPASRLGIVAGDKVKKVNGQHVVTTQSFYEALQDSGAFFKLEVVDKQGEIRFVQSAIYEGEHHELGIVFVKPPFRTSS